MQIGPDLVYLRLHNIEAVPLNFNLKVQAYLHIEILHIVIFYNNSVGDMTPILGWPEHSTSRGPVVKGPPHASHIGLCTEPILRLFRRLQTGSVRFGYGIIAPYTNHKNTGVTVPYPVVMPRYSKSRSNRTTSCDQTGVPNARARLMASLPRLRAYL